MRRGKVELFSVLYQVQTAPVFLCRESHRCLTAGVKLTRLTLPYDNGVHIMRPWGLDSRSVRFGRGAGRPHLTLLKSALLEMRRLPIYQGLCGRRGLDSSIQHATGVHHQRSVHTHPNPPVARRTMPSLCCMGLKCRNRKGV